MLRKIKIINFLGQVLELFKYKMFKNKQYFRYKVKAQFFQYLQYLRIVKYKKQ